MIFALIRTAALYLSGHGSGNYQGEYGQNLDSEAQFAHSPRGMVFERIRIALLHWVRILVRQLSGIR